MQITRRLGAPTQQRHDNHSQSGPAVFATSTGDAAVIGNVPSPEDQAELLGGSSLPEGFHLVVVPRDAWIKAGLSLPTS